MARIHFTEFAEVTKHIPHRPRLIDMVLQDGYVHMEDAEWDALKRRSQEARDASPAWDGPVSKRYYTVGAKEHLPPCMRMLMEGLRKGVNLSHAQRFAVASFLLRVNVSIDSIDALFSSTPNYKPHVTQSQLGQIKSNDYAPPSCATMAQNGACVPDPLCMKCRSDGTRMVSHPLHYVGLAMGRKQE